MSTSLIWLLFFLVAAVLLIFSAMAKKRFSTKEITVIALMAALAFVAYTFLKIPVSIAGSTSSIHIGNMFPALTALLLDGYCGGLAGAIGLALADVISGSPHYALTTFILKYLIGFVCGTVAHKAFKLNSCSPKDGASYYGKVIAAAASGLVLNIFTDPFLGYFRKLYIQGVPADFASVLTKISSAATAVNSLICTLLAVLLYLALKPAMKKAGFSRK